ncbi:phosphoribosylformylglycinamidine synthase subunit PurQ [bacterium]|nr:phosphoribosylformylglycinamidine synthase subunit PurQ [bacterium]
MRVGVVVFPGSNCDHDCYYAFKHVLNQDTEYIWHKREEVSGFDLIVLPGGFSYGDYLRTGAIARFSPVMNAIGKFADDGGTVMGICNGFQILCEAGLLPGALIRNQSMRFVCKHVHLRVENSNTLFTNQCRDGELLNIPIAHAEGLYYTDRETLAQLNENRQVLFRYCNADGETTGESNPNGSLQNIAGIMNREGNVLGMMPHPDRCAEEVLNSSDGVKIFASVIKSAIAEVEV